MSLIERSSDNFLSQWWWTVDRISLALFLLIMLVGILLVATASGPVALRLHLPETYFASHQLMILPVAIAIMIGVSMLSPTWIRRLGVVLFLLAIVLLILTLFKGEEAKGATRWIRVAGFSLQASEFAKPALAVVCGWLFSMQRHRPSFPGQLWATIAYGTTALLLILQPDFGMLMMVTGIWATQYFLNGLRISYILGGLVFIMTLVLIAYLSLSHVAARIDTFLNSEAGDRYQVERSLDAFAGGSWFGRGSGEGRVKEVLPDVHADFIFAVAGEEFGLIPSLGIISLYILVILRGLRYLRDDQDSFVVLASAAMLVSFTMQTLINLGSTMHILPTKGMTLPFISYGGSSLLAMSLNIGMYLGLTRRRPKFRSRGIGNRSRTGFD
jgi:cell division protein FtsW